MNSLDKLVKLAARFERKIALGQAQSAQPGEIDRALQDAGVRPTANDVAPYLNKARIPEDASVDIKIKVYPTQRVEFITTPAFPGLNGLLNRDYSPRMQQALARAQKAPAEPMLVNIAKF